MDPDPDYYPYPDDYPYPDYYPYTSALIDPLAAGIRVTAVQAKLSESEPSTSRSVALILKVRDTVARTRGVADAAGVRWNEALLRGAAGSLATTWSVQLVAQGAEGDILIDECRFRVPLR
jgi:hypothetical protein